MIEYQPIPRKAVASSGSIEMTENLDISQHRSSNSGENTGPNAGPATKPLLVSEAAPSVFKIFLRTAQLDTLWGAGRRLRGHGPQIEQRKQAIYKGIGAAIVTLVAAHLLPLAGALTLLVFNFRGYYIGGEMQGGNTKENHDLKLNVLQFVAKFHELTMQASLSMVVIGLIRHDLMEGGAVPFGAIFGSLQFANVSYLVSKEFVGVLKAKLASPVVKARLIGLLVLGTILAVTVGPSSAIAMRPRYDYWQAGGTDIYLNTTREKMWPARLDASSIPTACRLIGSNSSCISRDWESFGSQLIAFYSVMTSDMDTAPDTIQLGDTKSIREVTNRSTRGLYRILAAMTTTPMSNLANVIADNGRLWTIAAANLHRVTKKRRRFVWRTDVIYSIKDVKQPYTAAKCHNFNSTYLQQDLRQKRIDDGLMLFPTFDSLCEDDGKLSQQWSQVSVDQRRIVNEFLVGRSDKPQLEFAELPSDVFGKASIGAIASLPPTWPGGGRKLYSCVIHARWVPATIKSTRDRIKIVMGDYGSEPSYASGLCYNPLTPIQMTAEWASYLNPIVEATNKTVYQSLIEKVGIPPASWGRDPRYFGSVTETVLASMVTGGLSRIESAATAQGDLNSCRNTSCSCGTWCLDMMPKEPWEFGYGRNIFNVSTFDAAKSVKFTMRADIQGYAYNIRGPSMILSCVVLVIYCMLVIMHIGFVLVKRSSSNSWDSVSEVVALAMQSRPTLKLKNTCAGIYSTAVFSNLVRVVRTGPNRDHLELDFGDGGAIGVDDEIVEKAFYG